VDGRGDLDINQFAKFVFEILCEPKSRLDLERRAAAANLFSSYLLGEFYRQNDHWSVVRGWTVCAALIAWAGLSGKYPDKHWISACKIAQDAALVALQELAKEVLSEKAFDVRDRELDDYTRTRNTCALAAAACWQLICDRTKPEFKATLELLLKHLQRGRLLFWGEGALSQFLMIIWMLERAGLKLPADAILLGLIEGVAGRNAKQSHDPYEDVYTFADESLAKLFGKQQEAEVARRKAVESYSLLPMVMLAVRRNLRQQLEALWQPITDVALTWFGANTPEDFLLWHCTKGKEYSQAFAPPRVGKSCRVRHRVMIANACPKCCKMT
jgi:hypothetical protein